MSEGSIEKKRKLCNTNMYINAVDQDGNSNGCNTDDNTWGFGWSGGDNNPCPMDDPAQFGSMIGLHR
jgi:hypothetical protein